MTEIKQITELEEQIQFYKDNAALVRITYPKLSAMYLKTAEYLEELQRLMIVLKIEVKSD